MGGTRGRAARRRSVLAFALDRTLASALLGSALLASAPVLAVAAGTSADTRPADDPVILADDAVLSAETSQGRTAGPLLAEGRITLRAAGDGAALRLPSLLSVRGGEGPGARALLVASGGAAVDAPNLGRIDRASVLLEDAGSRLDVPGLVGLERSMLTLGGGASLRLPRTWTIDGTAISVGPGCTLELPAVPVLGTSEGPSTGLAAVGLAGLIDLPGLVRIVHGRSGWPLRIAALDGGRVLMPGLESVAGRVIVRCADRGSVVDLGRLGRLLGVGSSPDGAELLVSAGGRIDARRLERIDRARVELAGPASVLHLDRLDVLARSALVLEDGASLAPARLAALDGTSIAVMSGSELHLPGLAEWPRRREPPATDRTPAGEPPEPDPWIEVLGGESVLRLPGLARLGGATAIGAATLRVAAGGRLDVPVLERIEDRGTLLVEGPGVELELPALAAIEGAAAVETDRPRVRAAGGAVVGLPRLGRITRAVVEVADPASALRIAAPALLVGARGRLAVTGGASITAEGMLVVDGGRVVVRDGGRLEIGGDLLVSGDPDGGLDLGADATLLMRGGRGAGACGLADFALLEATDVGSGAGSGADDSSAPAGGLVLDPSPAAVAARGRLVIGPGARVRLVDRHDHGGRGRDGSGEGLVVGEIEFADVHGRLVLDGTWIRAGRLIGDPGQVIAARACRRSTGDLDDDGLIDTSDLVALLSAWGLCPAADPCPADLDGDGIVGPADLLLLLGAWTGLDPPRLEAVADLLERLGAEGPIEPDPGGPDGGGRPVTVNRGTLAPAETGGFAVVEGRFEQGGAGFLRMDVADERPVRGFDLLVVSGPARLGGTLDVRIVGRARRGGAIPLVVARSIEGRFDRVTVVDAAGRPVEDVEVIYRPEAVLLRIGARDAYRDPDHRSGRRPVLDLNRDGRVGVDDLILALLALDAVGGLADVDGDGAVTAEDLAILLQRWIE